MTEPRRRKASEMPPYRHTADRLADLEERCTALERQIEAVKAIQLEFQRNIVQRMQAVENEIGELQRHWQEDHETLYLLVHQRIDDLQAKLEQAEEQNASESA